MEMHAFGRLTPVPTARRRLMAAVRPIRRVEWVPVTEAGGRVLARTVRAPRAVPSFARTTWDGYSLRSADVRRASRAAPVKLRLVGEVYAEEAFRGRVGPGEAVAIATGGAIPRGADAVIIFEEVSLRDGAVVVARSVPRGDRVSPPGHDFPRGALLAASGTVLGPVELGAVASCGVARLLVYARPVVTILPNGNELIVPGRRGTTGKIYESNNAALAAVVTAAGCVARPMPPVPDDPAAIARALEAALRDSDLVLATGGSSVGERDHLPRILPRLGGLLFHGIAVRAGKPTLAARCGDVVILGMPGHPTSCLVNMYWLVLPALRRLARLPGPGTTPGWAVLGATAVAPSPELSTVVPLAFRGGRAYSTYRGSSVITSLAGATAYAMLPPGRGRFPRGTRLRVHHLDPPLGPAVVPDASANG